MPDSEKDALDHVIDDLIDEVKLEDYDPDQFLDEAQEELSFYGYNTKNEVIWEFREDEEEDLVDDHLEVITVLDDRGNEQYVRFILEEGRPERDEVPKIDRVYAPEEFDYRV